MGVRSASPIGKFLRVIRVNNGLTMREMSAELSISSASYLSAIELGDRNAPKNMAVKIVGIYGVGSIESVNYLIDISRPSIKVSLREATDKQRETMAIFMRSFKRLNDSQLEDINIIIRETINSKG